MGQCTSALSPPKELTVLVIGLDNSGKSTLCATIKGDLDPVTVPTVGFSTPIRKHMYRHEVVFYDLGGGARIRGVWPSYFAEVHGVVFVVDAAEPGRVAEAATELQQALLHPMVVGKPLLVLANKQDLPSALSEVDLAQNMGLDQAATLCRHHITACVAKASANGGVVDARIFDGLQWLIEAINADFASLHARRGREMAEFAAADEERRKKQTEDYAAAQARKKAEKERKAAEAAAAAAAGSTGESSNTGAGAMPLPATAPTANNGTNAQAAAGSAGRTGEHVVPTSSTAANAPTAAGQLAGGEVPGKGSGSGSSLNSSSAAGSERPNANVDSATEPPGSAATVVVSSPTQARPAALHGATADAGSSSNGATAVAAAIAAAAGAAEDPLPVMASLTPVPDGGSSTPAAGGGAAATAAPVRAASGTAASGGNGWMSGETATPAPAPAPKPAAKPAITCSVCKTTPAVRRSAAAKWEPVCGPCGTRLDEQAAAARAAEEQAGQAAEAGAK